MFFPSFFFRQLAAEFKEPYLTLCALLPAQSHLTGSAEKSDLVLYFEKIRTYLKNNAGR
ncbi:MAG: hypothetical protein AAB492_03235 [Patescibacteria group bacterium]